MLGTLQYDCVTSITDLRPELGEYSMEQDICYHIGHQPFHVSRLSLMQAGQTRLFVDINPNPIRILFFHEGSHPNKTI